jgi:ATP:ADP antiporter, AAA family
MHKQNELKPFGKFRAFFWPIHLHEHKKLIPMFMLFFLISFIYNLLRNMKMALLVTAEGSGAEVVPFMKIGFVLPGALLMTYLFTKLTSHFTRENVFYSMLSGFIIYFTLFAFILFPCRDFLELTAIPEFLGQFAIFNEGLKGLLAIIRHWNLALFYVLSEMWSVVILSMLFWGFANEVTKVDEAKRFYAIFALGANISCMFIGLYTGALFKLDLYNIPFYEEKYQWVFYQLITVLLLGLLIFYIFHKLNNKWLNINNAESLQIPKKKNTFSLTECFQFLKESRYLRYIVIIVIGYNIVYNLADVMWTHKVKSIYSDSKDYNNYVSQVSLATGFAAVCFALVVSSNAIRFYGWTVAALVTPFVWLITGLPFYFGMTTGFSTFNGVASILGASSFLGDMVLNLLSNPEAFILFLGTAQICLGRGCKYTVFDETKEITFIPLSKEEQRKGKAIVDGLASRVGKSGGSVIYIVLLFMFGNLAQAIPYVFSIWLVVLVLWIWAIVSLGKMVNKYLEPDKDQETEEKETILSEQVKPIAAY